MLMEYILIILGLFVYFLPSLGAYKQENFLSIFIVNILFGWTIIGWIVCFIWASQKEKEPTTLSNNRESMTSQRDSTADELDKLIKLKEQGHLTETEFKLQKAKLLYGG